MLMFIFGNFIISRFGVWQCLFNMYCWFWVFGYPSVSCLFNICWVLSYLFYYWNTCLFYICFYFRSCIVYSIIGLCIMEKLSQVDNCIWMFFIWHFLLVSNLFMMLVFNANIHRSHAMNNHEKGYCITRKELLAIYYFCQHFNHYLYGKRFKLRIDHKAIIYAVNKEADNNTSLHMN